MIKFDNVTVRKKNHILLAGVSFEACRGEKICFCGKSGSGKTTLLTTIVGAHIPAAGTVCFKNRPLSSKNILSVRQSVSYIGQEPVLGAHRVLDALMLPFTYRANKHSTPPSERINGVLEQLHLDAAILDKETNVISGGEKQRVAIARALLLGKTVFIADEITAGLDAQSKNAVLGLFRDAACTIVSVSHDPAWFGLCSRFYFLDRGRIVSVSDTPGAVIKTS